MNRLTRRRALRAAAGLAMVSLAGCGGVAEVASGGDAAPRDAAFQNGSDSGTDSDGSLPADSSYVDVGSCDLGKDADGGLNAGSVECCLKLTEASAWGIDAGEFVSDPAVSGCCHGLNDTMALASYVYGPDNWPANVCQACADAVGNSTACTPWGPPVPPPMLEVA